MKMMKKVILCLLSLILLVELSACAHKEAEKEPKRPTVENPPYNDFDQSSLVPKKVATRVGEGIVTGTVAGSLMSSPAPLLGGLIGGAVGGAYVGIQAAEDESPKHIIKLMQDQDHIQVVQEDGLITLIVPTDPYYTYNSYELDETGYPGLVHIAQLVLRDSGNETIYIAGFSDSGIGSESKRQKLSDDRARSMADFLWANGIPLNRLDIKGYGDRYDIADNYLIHGSAMNRRVEIQWKRSS